MTMTPLEWLLGSVLATPSKLNGLILIISASPKFVNGYVVLCLSTEYILVPPKQPILSFTPPPLHALLPLFISWASTIGLHFAVRRGI